MDTSRNRTITYFHMCIFHRVTGTVPLPMSLPLNDLIPIVLSAEMNENVSPGKGWGSLTDLNHWEPVEKFEAL